MNEQPEPLTLPNALDVLRSWSWLYDGLQRSDWIGDGDTDRHIAEGAAKGRNRQCSIGWHEECSDRSGVNWRGECQCPCHRGEWEKAARLMRWMDQCLTELSGADA